MHHQRLGFFVDIEGTDGSGKSTLAKALLSHYGTSNAILTNEPRDPIRKLTHDPESGLCEKSVLFLFCADRAQNIETVIAPAISRGKMVISDRFSFSSMAYQHYGFGLPMNLVNEAQALATGTNYWPNLTIFLNADPDLAFARAGGTDRYERLGLDFQKRVYAGYQELFENALHSQKLVVSISVTKDTSPEDILKQAISYIDQMYKN